MPYLAIVSLIWAFSFGLIGTLLAGVDPYFIATARLGCATLLFLPFLRPHCIRIEERFKLVAYGSIQFGLMYVCYMHAFRYLPSHLVALFSVLTPVYVVLINDLRKRRFSRRYLMAAILSVTGAIAIKAEGVPAGDVWRGFALMQVAGLSFAYGQIAYRDWKRRHRSIPDKQVFSFLTFGGTVCAGASCMFFTDRDALLLEPLQGLAILYLGLIASGVGFFLWNKGAARSNAGVLAAFNNAVVPLGVILSLFAFGEAEDLSRQDFLRLLLGVFLVGGGVVVGRGKRG